MVPNLPTHRSSRPEVFCKKCFLRKSLENVFLKKAPTQVFSCEFRKVFENTFFVERIQWLLLYPGYHYFNVELGKSKKVQQGFKMRWIQIAFCYKMCCFPRFGTICTIQKT